MQAYLRAGEERAYRLGNRGPIRFTADGRIDPAILDAYWRCGFYVFEGVLGADELADIEHDLFDILDRLPVAQGSPVRRQGAAGARRRLRRVEPVLFEAVGRPVRRHRPRQRPPPGQDVRADPG